METEEKSHFDSTLVLAEAINNLSTTLYEGMKNISTVLDERMMLSNPEDGLDNLARALVIVELLRQGHPKETARRVAVDIL